MIIVLAEHDHKQIKAQTWSTVNAGYQLGDQVCLLVLGHACQDLIRQAQGRVDQLLICDHATLEHGSASVVTQACMQAIEQIKPTHFIAPATSTGKNVLPCIAAKSNVAQVSDIIAIVAEDTFKRPIYAGNAIATVKSVDPLKVITVRSSAFASDTPEDKQTILDQMAIQCDDPVAFNGCETQASDRPDLASADIVVSGGRGLKEQANFVLIERLADKLGAAVGASRAAVDAGWVSNDLQVGQTGQVVAPKLYIAVGISGAIQHLAGMKDSGVIVAINSDPDAPIFEVADYGLVADLFDVLPKLEASVA